ncbi:MAG: major capsid protein [Deltaproteobacteria bacterium]|jgi:hypothetical protein|nr:major capsid protein [Deltaproteobacteria bacterium]
MATTRIADLPIKPTYFASIIEQRSLALDAFVQSGIAVVDAGASLFLQQNDNAARTYSPRYLGPLPDEEENASTDDPAVKSTPSKITGFVNTAVRHDLNKSWSTMDLAVSLAGRDPMGAVRNQLADYWRHRRQARLLASVKGVVAESVASHGGDLVNDISTNAGADGLINEHAIIDAATTLGDRADSAKVMCVHSTVYATMSKLNLIQTERLESQPRSFRSFLGYEVIQDDDMTTGQVNMGTGQSPNMQTTYYTYIFGPGAVAIGSGAPKVPFESKRDPDAGNGGGQETIFSRVSWIVHPQGYSFGVTSGTPTYAQLELGTNWTRAWERKRIPLAVIISRG